MTPVQDLQQLAASPWKRRLLIAAGVALALVGAFSAGRFSAPLKVQTIETVKTVFQDRVVEKIKTVEVQAKAETKIVYRDRVVTKDGTVTEHTVEKTDTKSEDVKKGSDDELATHTGSTETLKQTTTTLRPDWRVGILVGGQLGKPFLPIAGPLTVGLQVDRRIIGGLSVGVWAFSGGSAGLGVSFEF